MHDWEKDKILAESIRNALENLEEQYTPGAWESFVNLRKRKRRIFYIKMGSGIAAALVGILLIAQVLTPESYNTPLETNYIINNKSDQSGGRHENNKTIREAPLQQDRENIEALATLSDESDETDTGEITKVSVERNEKLPQKAVEETIALLENLPVKTSGTTDYSDTVLVENGEHISDSENFVPVMADESELVRGNAEKKKAGQEKVRFGIHFSPGFNSTTSNSMFAFSGGISADFRLTRSLGFSTGIVAEQQNVVVQEKNNQFMGLGKETTARMLFLDIPLNIIWKFYSDNSTSYYVSGGFSSLAYLSEDYQNKTTTQELIEVVREENGQESVEYAVVTREAVTSASARSFQNFDVASRFNMMVGLEQRITTGLHFHIEPYLKIPLTGLGAQNLKYSTAGVTCKLSF